MIIVEGAQANNLRNVDVSFPLGTFTAVTGVSGSGKSSLVNDILYRVLANRLNGARKVPGKHRRVGGLDQLDKVVHVDQGADRAHAAVQPGDLHGRVRPHPHAVLRDRRGQGPRLPARPVQLQRQGRPLRGVLRRRHHQDRDELPARRLRRVRGLRRPAYNRETLQVHYKGKNIAEVLEMPISEAAEFFEPISAIHRYLKTLVDVGLGYVQLGQSATTLSGGEAQRVKLATELQRRSNGRSVYVLDEPTTGLHFEDVRKLLKVLGKLVEKGNTVIVIEHSLDVIKSADWIIDLGPEERFRRRPGRRGRHPGAGRRGAREPHRLLPARDLRGRGTARRRSELTMRSTVPYRPRPGEIPTDPGVYRFRDADRRVLYVGKAKNLRARLSNYFAPCAPCTSAPDAWSPPRHPSSGPSSRATSRPSTSRSRGSTS